MHRRGAPDRGRRLITELSAPTLLERARDGDVDAWESLYRSMYGQLHAFARRRLPADHLADDAVSETMTRALTKLSSFESPPGGVEGWLFGILRNVIHENLRSFVRSAAAIRDVESPELGPLGSLVDAERSADLQRAFEKLNESERELLELRAVARLDATQVGVVLGMSAGAVRTAQSRALTRLRTFFQEVNQ